MAASMGHVGNPGHPDVQNAIKRAIELIVKRGGVAGTLVNDDNLETFLSMGVKCVGTAWLQWLKQSGEVFLERIQAAS